MTANKAYLEDNHMRYSATLSSLLGGTLLFVGLTSGTAFADQAADIAQLKQQVAELQEARLNEENSLASRVQIHSSISQGYLKSTDNNWIGETEKGTFHFNEFLFNVSCNITDKLQAGIQVMSRDLGPIMNNEPKIDWAFADYSWLNELGLRIGRVKVPYGLYNESRDVDTARISILLPQAVYQDRARDFTTSIDGFGVYGNISIGIAGSLDYQFVYGKLDVDSSSALIGRAESQGGMVSGSASGKVEDMYFSTLTWATPLDGLMIGASYQEVKPKYEGSHSSGSALFRNDHLTRWVASLEYTWNDLVLAAEYMDSKLESEKTGRPDSQIKPMGWYVSASYRFSNWFAQEVYYSELYNNKDDKNGSSRRDLAIKGFQKDVATYSRFDINDYWLIKAGVTFSNGVGGCQLSELPNDDSVKKNWMMYQIKTTVFF